MDLSYIISLKFYQKKTIGSWSNPNTVQSQQNKFHTLGNITKLLAFMRSEGIRFSMSSEQLYNLDAKSVLGTVWALIQKYDRFSKSELIAWVNYLLTESVPNLNKAWSDGALLVKLLNRLDEKLISQDALSLAPEERIAKCLEVCATIGLPQILEISDFMVNPHENIIMMFLANLRNFYEGEMPNTGPDVNDLMNQLNVETEKNEDLTKQLESISAENLELETNKLSSDMELRALKDKLNEYSTSLKKATTQIENLETERNNYKGKVGQYEEELISLREKIKHSTTSTLNVSRCMIC